MNKSPFIMLTALLVLAFTSMALRAQPVSGADQLFEEAKLAYDEGNVEQAIKLYEKILDQGRYAPELFFNLANAYFRADNTGKALLFYRRAELLAPGDPDIEANRNFAMKHAGLEAPAVPLFLEIFSKFTFAQWAGFATAIYWLGAVLICAWLFRRTSLPGGWPRTTTVLILLLLLGGVGLWRTSAAVFGTEAVIMEKNQSALYAPLERSTPHFSLSEGSLVRVLDESDDWLKIASGKDTGWIPAASCEIVHPW